jgi:CheY-like chemotaxis protein
MVPTEPPLVLIVDDSWTNSALAASVLKRSGYRTEVVRSGEEFRAWLKGGRPQVIVMDVQLPDVDGFALTKEVRSAPDTADIPIIALTSRALKEDAMTALDAGCDDYLVKPLNPQTFPAKVAEVLELVRKRASPA